jgi:FtsZ-binding cell division protein ZapB
MTEEIWQQKALEYAETIESLRMERYDLKETIESLRIEKFNLQLQIYALEDSIKEVLEWRNLDGDGISDPLRKQLYKLLKLSEDK